MTDGRGDPDWDKLSKFGAGPGPHPGTTAWQYQPGTYSYELLVKQSLFSPWRVDRENCTDYVMKNVKLPAYYGVLYGATKTTLEYMQLDFAARDKLIPQYWRKGFRASLGYGGQWGLAVGSYCAARCLIEKAEMKHTSSSGVWASVAAGALIGAKNGLGSMFRLSCAFALTSVLADLFNWGAPMVLGELKYSELPAKEEFLPVWYLHSQGKDAPKDVAAVYLEERYGGLNEEGLRQRVGFDYLRK